MDRETDRAFSERRDYRAVRRHCGINKLVQGVARNCVADSKQYVAIVSSATPAAVAVAAVAAALQLQLAANLVATE